MVLDTLAVKVGGVDAVQPADVRVALGLERGPVKLEVLRAGELEPGCVMREAVLEVRGMPHELFGDAACARSAVLMCGSDGVRTDVNTCTAEVGRHLDYGDLFPIGCGAALQAEGLSASHDAAEQQ